MGCKWLRCAGQRERARESENSADFATRWMANSCFLKIVTCLCHNTKLHCSFRFACKSPLSHTPNLLIPTRPCNKFEVICSEVHMGWKPEQHYKPNSDVVHLCLSSNACHPTPSHNSLCIPRNNRHFFYHLFKNLRVKISSMAVIKPRRFSPSISEAVHIWWPWQHGHQDLRHFPVVLLVLQLSYFQLKYSSSVKTDAKSKRPFCCVWGGDQCDYIFTETDGTVYTTALMHIWFVFEWRLTDAMCYFIF